MTHSQTTLPKDADPCVLPQSYALTEPALSPFSDLVPGLAFIMSIIPVRIVAARQDAPQAWTDGQSIMITPTAHTGERAQEERLGTMLAMSLHVVLDHASHLRHRMRDPSIDLTLFALALDIHVLNTLVGMKRLALQSYRLPASLDAVSRCGFKAFWDGKLSPYFDIMKPPFHPAFDPHLSVMAIYDILVSERSLPRNRTVADLVRLADTRDSWLPSIACSQSPSIGAVSARAHMDDLIAAVDQNALSPFDHPLSPPAASVSGDVTTGKDWARARRVIDAFLPNPLTPGAAIPLSFESCGLENWTKIDIARLGVLAASRMDSKDACRVGIALSQFLWELGHLDVAVALFECLNKYLIRCIDGVTWAEQLPGFNSYLDKVLNAKIA